MTSILGLGRVVKYADIDFLESCNINIHSNQNTTCNMFVQTHVYSQYMSRRFCTNNLETLPW